MELIIGGMAQGKLAYAQGIHPDICFQDGSSLSLEELCKARGVYRFDAFVYHRLKEGGDVSTLAETLMKQAPDLILVSCEAGYGVVPADPFERRYREALGRICTQLAAFSHSVVRIVCGLEVRLK